MSALEPDAPARHVFPHPREAVRAWWAHRQGAQPSRAAMGAIRGKGPAVGDLVRVGQLLADLDLLDAGELTPMGEQVVRWALTGGTGARETKLQAITKRLARWMRKTGIAAEASPRNRFRRDMWRDVEGIEHESTYDVDSA